MNTDGEANNSPIHPVDETLSLGGDAPPELALVLEEYMAALAAGETPDREKLLAEHAAIAGTLRECLSAIEFIHGASRKIAGPPVAGVEPAAQLGDFRITREIGSGGMGVVYEAEQISLGRKVALKVLRFGPASDPEAMQRFQREAQTVAQLHHTNIVPIFAVGEERGIHYYAMQFIEGESVADVAARASAEGGEPLDMRDVAGWGLEAADALAHAHARGVIHRDVKPSNLLLDLDGRVWLTDFGLARRLDDVTLSLSGMLLGTPRYMSPEQASAARRPVDHRSDVYSLGATLYELVTGKPAFDADTAQGIIAQILERDPPPPGQFRADLPRDLETIVVKCLAKEPGRRYQSAGELAEDLRAFLDGRDIRARRPTLAERVVRWVKRNQRIATVAAWTAAVTVALVVAALSGWRRFEGARLGLLTLKTAGPRLVAQVVDEKDRPIVPSFAVPTAEPVPIPEGTYRLRLSASGLPSETWPLDVERGVERSVSLELRRRWLWPPMELRPDDYPEIEVVELEGTADIVVLSHKIPAPHGRFVRRIQRVEGTTGRTLWSLNLDESTLPEGGVLDEWTSLLAHSGVLSGDRLLLSPAVDLSGDGVADLVWLGRLTSSLLAVSGRDGVLLWWYRGRPKLPHDVEGLKGTFEAARRRGGVTGRPALADVDGDGVRDCIACFASYGETFVAETGRRVGTGSQSWVEAVSGKTGRSLWRRSAPPDSFEYAYDSDTAEHNDRLCRPRVGRVRDREVVLLAIGSKLFGFDLETGSDVWPALELGFEPRRAPRLADLDGDGEPEALLHRLEQDGGQTVVTLTAMSPKTRAVLWRTSFQPTDDLPERADEEWFRAEDLDGDGRPEVLFASGEFATAWGGKDRGGITVLDGFGEVRWQRRLAARPVDRLVSGPDIDADGAREVFASWFDYDPEKRSSQVVAAALSGADGHTLWRSRHEVAGTRPERSERLAWWQADRDGWPLLIVPGSCGFGGQATTLLLSAGNGRLSDTLFGVYAPEVADVTGDGLGDLVYRVAPQGAPRLLVVPGVPPEPWRRLGVWSGAADFDRDGYTDLVGSSWEGTARAAVTARSGRDGKELWRSRGSRVGTFLSPPHPFGDLDRDGSPDFVSFTQGRRAVSPHSFVGYQTVSAFSGKNGQRLWTAEDFDMRGGGGSGSRRSWSWESPALEWCDLDGDARAEFLVSHDRRDEGPTLSALRGSDGRLLWQTPAARGVVGMVPNPGPLWLADLDGDGWSDPVLWVPQGGSHTDDGPCDLQALSGRDGRALWSAPPLSVRSRSFLSWPRAEGGDLDGDGRPEIVVALDHGYDRERRGYQCTIAVLGGRNGLVQWTWSRTGSAEILPPRVVDLEGEGRRFICVGLTSREDRRIVILDSAGEVREEIELELMGHGLRDTAHLWRHADLDSDGREELLYFSRGELHAAHGKGDVLWRWPLPAVVGAARHYLPGPARITEVLPGNRPDSSAPGGGERGAPATVVVWSGKSVHGVDGATGQPRWRCDVPWTPATGISTPPSLHRLSAGDSELPRYLCRWSQTQPDLSATAVRQAWPTDAGGAYLITPGQPVELEPVDDATIERSLPWVGEHSVWKSVLFLPLLGLVVFFLAVLPGWLTLGAVRRNAPAVSVLAAGWSVAWVLGLPENPESLIWLASLGVLAVPGQLAFWAIRRRSSWLGVLAAVALVTLVVPAVVRYLTSWLLVHPEPWYEQLTSAFVVPAVGLAAGLPSIVFCTLAVVWVRERCWRPLGFLVGGAFALALAISLVLLAVDAGRKDALEFYSWHGWYLAGILGAYATGGLVVAAVVLRRVRERFTRVRGS